MNAEENRDELTEALMRAGNPEPGTVAHTQIARGYLVARLQNAERIGKPAHIERCRARLGGFDARVRARQRSSIPETGEDALEAAAVHDA